MSKISKGIIALLVLVSLLGINQSFSQTVLDVFNAKEITWYGLDFTKAKMIGHFATFNEVGKKTGRNIKDEYFEGWNEIIYKEPKKFDLEKYFHVDLVRFNSELVRKFNSEVDETTIMSDAPIETALTKGEIQTVVKKYANSKTGIGVVFIVEKFDETEKLGVVDIVYFNENSGDVILVKKLSASGSGLGLRNFWMTSIHNILQYIGLGKWAEWKKKALKESKEK